MRLPGRAEVYNFDPVINSILFTPLRRSYACNGRDDHQDSLVLRRNISIWSGPLVQPL